MCLAISFRILLSVAIEIKMYAMVSTLVIIRCYEKQLQENGFAKTLIMARSVLNYSYRDKKKTNIRDYGFKELDIHEKRLIKYSIYFCVENIQAGWKFCFKNRL